MVACCVWSCFALTHLKLNEGFLGLDSHSCGIFLTKCTCQNHLKKSQQVGCSSISWAGQCNLTTKRNWVGKERCYTSTTEAAERRIFSIWHEPLSETALLGRSQRWGKMFPSRHISWPPHPCAWDQRMGSTLRRWRWRHEGSPLAALTFEPVQLHTLTPTPLRALLLDDPRSILQQGRARPQVPRGPGAPFRAALPLQFGGTPFQWNLTALSIQTQALLFSLLHPRT